MTRKRLLVGAVVLAAAVGAGIAIGLELGGGSESAPEGTTAATTTSPVTTTGPAATGSVEQVDETWTCRTRVDLDLVRITMTEAAGAVRKKADAVHLRPGCTGRIGRLEVTQSAGDGVKVAEGVHDLVIEGGFVQCLAKAPNLHQDGVQVLGGDRITFRHLNIDCGRPGERLINANLFINKAGRSTHPPTDVVCEECTFGGDAAHTVNIQNSVRSGASGSTFCAAKYPRLTLTVGSDAYEPVTEGNLYGRCAGHDLGQPVEPHVHG